MGEGDKICDTLGKGKSNDLYFHFCTHVDDLKIMSIVLLCPHLYLRPYFMGMTFFFAVVDTWFDGLVISAALALLHAVLVRSG